MISISICFKYVILSCAAQLQNEKLQADVEQRFASEGLMRSQHTEAVDQSHVTRLWRAIDCALAVSAAKEALQLGLTLRIFAKKNPYAFSDKPITHRFSQKVKHLNCLRYTSSYTCKLCIPRWVINRVMHLSISDCSIFTVATGKQRRPWSLCFNYIFHILPKSAIQWQRREHLAKSLFPLWSSVYCHYYNGGSNNFGISCILFGKDVCYLLSLQQNAII